MRNEMLATEARPIAVLAVRTPRAIRTVDQQEIRMLVRRGERSSDGVGFDFSPEWRNEDTLVIERGRYRQRGIETAEYCREKAQLCVMHIAEERHQYGSRHSLAYSQWQLDQMPSELRDVFIHRQRLHFDQAVDGSLYVDG